MTAERLLYLIGSVPVPALPEFVAAEKFRVGETTDGLTVGWLDDNFKKHFLGKIEEAVEAAELRVHELIKPSRDPALIAELGGGDKAEISLGQFWHFLTKANRVRWWVCWYCAHIRDLDRVLWVVSASWGGVDLRVAVRSVDNPFRLDAGRRFLSR